MKKTISIIIALTLVATIGVAQDKPRRRRPQRLAADPIVIAAGDIVDPPVGVRGGAQDACPAEYQQYARAPARSSSPRTTCA